MLTSKQRSNLRAMANDMQPIFQIGKSGLTDTVIEELSNALESHELVKITVLKNTDVNAKQIINELAELLSAEPVSALGNKVVLYRFSNKKDFKHIEIE